MSLFMKLSERIAEKSHTECQPIKIKAPRFEPRAIPLLYTMPYTLILGAYFASRKTFFVLIISTGQNICRKKQAIKSTQ